MVPNEKFKAQSKAFWANVRTISQEVNYTERGNSKKNIPSKIKVPSIDEVRAAYKELQLDFHHIGDEKGRLTEFGSILFEYFAYRADVLNNIVKHHLMSKDEAGQIFNRLKSSAHKCCPLPMNKQKGDKSNHAFLTGIVNILIESNIGEHFCDYDPRSLTTLTHNAQPLRTLSRRVDGAFPSVVNPVAIWEIKEYYYTTTFGSRVADGVYETLLDGMELEELEAASSIKVDHVLFIDDFYTWWECGRSYLCRIIDMLHMGYVDEVVFGREALTRVPELAKKWKATLEQRTGMSPVVPSTAPN